MLNVPTKQEPGIEYHRSNDYNIPQQSHCSSACKEPMQGYYVNATLSGHTSAQDQQPVVYTSSDKRVSWAPPPVAHNPNSHGGHRRHSAVPVVSLREYNIPTQTHKEYIQPPAAHTTRDNLTVAREPHLLAPGKSWGPPQALHQTYR